MSEFLADIFKGIFSGKRDIKEMLPYLFEEADGIIATRNGALVSAIRITGINPYTADDAEVSHINSALAEIIDKSGNNFSFHFHKMQAEYNDFDYQPKPFVIEGFGADIDKSWRSSITSSGLCMPILFLAVIERKTMSERLPIFGGLAGKAKGDNLAERMINLTELANSICETVGDGSHPLRISDGSFPGYLRGISTGYYAPLSRSEFGTIVDDIQVPLETFGRAVTIDTEFDTRYASVISIGNLSPRTMGGMLDSLYSDPDILISASYQPVLEDFVAHKAAVRVEQTMLESAGGKVAQQLMEAAEDLTIGEIGFGDTQTSVTVYAASPEELRKKVTTITAILKSKRLKVEVEKLGLSNAWFARFPGNYEFHHRSLTISNRNFADLAALHMVKLGKPASECYWGTPVTTFRSCANTPFDFAFHGRFAAIDAEPPFASTLVVGPPDAGKSTVTAFLAAQCRRSNTRIIAIDKDRSLEMPLRALGGIYTSVRAGHNTGLNPLQSETDEEGRAWLKGWLSALLESRGEQLSVADAEKLTRNIENNADMDPEFQDFSSFSTMFQSFEGDINGRVAEWAPSGPYGWVFGQGDAPIVDFSKNSIVGVDMTELLHMDLERTALLAYLFRQIEKTVSDRQPTLLILEEAGIFLDDLYFQKELKKWLATLRKKNVVVIMLVQYVSQIRECAAGSSILEGLQNHLILPHHQATMESYQGLNLSDAELSFVLGSHVGKRLALWRDGQGSSIIDVNLSALGPLLTALGGGKSAERKFGPSWREKQNFWRITE